MAEGARHRLLIIDDSSLIRKAAAVLLEDTGYEVRTAENVAEFDELLSEWWPDTILSDVQMPDVTGDVLCRELKSRLLVRVVLFSNIAPDRLAELAASSGADGYISKLAGFGQLPRLLDEIIRRPLDEPSHPSNAQASTERVILIDDSEQGREVTGTVLAKAGFDVRMAANLDQFDRVYSQWVPHLVLTVPKLEGFEEGEICRALKGRMGDKPVPVVFFSDQSVPEVIDLARRFGAEDGLSKLEGLEHVFSKLRDLCRPKA